MNDKELVSALRKEINAERSKLLGNSSGGGDFHVTFWKAAKEHISGVADLEEKVEYLISKDPKHRRRLYPELCNGFLMWWDESRRQRNEPLTISPKVVKAVRSFSDLNAVVRVENVLAIDIWDETSKVIYPYFSEMPVLSAEAARLGIWLLSETLSEYPSDCFRILDVLRGRSFDVRDVPLKGDEEELFLTKYEIVLRKWRDLREEYDF